MRYPTAEKMVAALKRSGMSQTEIGEKLGVTRAAVSLWASGGGRGIYRRNLEGLRALYRENRAEEPAPETPSEPVSDDRYERVLGVMVRVNRLPLERLEDLETLLEILER